MTTASARSASAAARAEPVSQFFAGLAAPGHLETLEGQSATVRFDAREDGSVQHWHVTMQNGDVSVTRAARPADAVVRLEHRHLEAMVTGRLNAQAALLRGVLSCEGSFGAVMMFQRCLPGPPGSVGRVAPISSQTVMAQRRPA